jgi:hypothetical protein
LIPALLRVGACDNCFKSCYFYRRRCWAILGSGLDSGQNPEEKLLYSPNKNTGTENRRNSLIQFFFLLFCVVTLALLKGLDCTH